MMRSKPSSAMPSVNTNSPAKNSSESHSTFSIACSKSSVEPINRMAIAPNSAAYAGSKCTTGWRKKSISTNPRIIPHLASRAWSRMGYLSLSICMSTSIFLSYTSFP